MQAAREDSGQVSGGVARGGCLSVARLVPGAALLADGGGGGHWRMIRRVPSPGLPRGVTSGGVKDLLAAGLYYLYELSSLWIHLRCFADSPVGAGNC